MSATSIAGFFNTYCTGVTTDPRIDQLVIFSTSLQHLLQRLSCYEQEHRSELQHLQAFQQEPASKRRLRAQHQVVKQVAARIALIVYKLRNECDKLQRYLLVEQQLKQLKPMLYERCVKLLQQCKEKLQQVPYDK